MAAREYVTDQITFISEAERAVAADIMATLIPAQLAGGASPDQAGRTAAAAAATRVKDLRRSYEEQVVRGLRARGALKEDQQGPPGITPAAGLPLGTPPVTATPGAVKRETVARMTGWAQEANQSQGWAPATPAAPAAT
jgi:hypothetical protein